MLKKTMLIIKNIYNEIVKHVLMVFFGGEIKYAKRQPVSKLMIGLGCSKFHVF
jgi:hypothetical protein